MTAYRAAQLHWGSQQCLFRLLQKYGTKLRLEIIDNSGRLEDAALGTLETIRRARYANLREVTDRAIQAVGEEYRRRQGKPHALSDALYRALLRADV